ncbi:LOW QUALITY PROTEIN: glycosyltransferase [Halarchaeum acidiphilum MH1-52-1]|uniref:Glycosyltransferase n=1 Tax=Halarchaeum acidiphilum MH1-52-1 TaxID=1261545 RepID=U3AGD1_9EURY|nr:LOW QUALITY PROTEIN: glycosyltransferase [Halarchaeum acidiphilum MH1-52-1]
MTEPPAVAAFTDTYLPTVNGATYTVRTWRECWQSRGGRMDVVYPDADYEPEPGEHPVASLDFPFYEGYRLAVPHAPRGVVAPDVVHAHSPFSVASRATATPDDTTRRSSSPTTRRRASTRSTSHRDAVAPAVERVSAAWERWFLDRADLVLAPSERTAGRVRDLGVATPVTALPNGVDIDFFEPTDASDFRERYDLSGTLVGYTGRHGYEKRLRDLVDAAADLDATLVLGGDGPARDDLETRARERGVDARFLGFLPREELPAFYSALDVFAFPSPVETQGLVALEANACGTPAVGADAGALIETVDDGETGYRYPVGDVAAFRDAIERALDERDALAATCLDRREEVSVSQAVDRLEAAYDRVR